MVTVATMPSIRIRPIGPGDRDALIGFYETLSAESLALRFHGASIGMVDRAAVFFCRADHERREGLVAILDEPGVRGAVGPTIVGHLSLEPSGAHEVEVAVAVADAWQRHGIGRGLLLAALSWAERHGIERLRVSMLSANVAMLGLIRSSGRVVAVSMPGAGIVDATIDLPTVLRPAA